MNFILILVLLALHIFQIINLHHVLDSFKTFVSIEFVISFILIIILLLTLLKKNYVNLYCLTAFNNILTCIV